MQTSSTRTWTRVTKSMSIDDNHYTKITFMEFLLYVSILTLYHAQNAVQG